MVWKIADVALFGAVALIINLGMLSAVLRAADFSQKSFGVFVVIVISREAVRKFSGAIREFTKH